MVQSVNGIIATVQLRYDFAALVTVELLYMYLQVDCWVPVFDNDTLGSMIAGEQMSKKFLYLLWLF